jgi:hypothetical protein
MQRPCVTALYESRDLPITLHFPQLRELMAPAIPENSFQSDWAQSESIRLRDAQKNGYHYVGRPII